MIEQTIKVLRYELHNLMRSKWVLIMGVFFLLATDAMFRFGSDPSKAIISLMNVVLIVMPLTSLILGIIYFYHSREFVELLLAQPMMRSSIFVGKVAGLSGALCAAFVAGVAIPFLIHGFSTTGYWGSLLTLMGIGCAFILIFVAIAFMLAIRFDDKIKGFGAAILLWLYLTVIYDAILLFAIHMLREYPVEPGLLVAAMLNPVDLGRILILLQLDISALMGYTGALFKHFYGQPWGIAMSAFLLAAWLTVPLWRGMRDFRRRDF